MDDRSPGRGIWLRPALTWLGLCALLATTCALAYVPLGRANLPISLAVAAIKASLVGVVFMRLSQDNPLNRLTASAGPLWAFIMFLLMGADYFSR